MKKYLVISIPKLFHYLGDLLHCVTYDEVILSDIPTPLNFDIKQKLGAGYDVASNASEVSDVVYNAHVQMFTREDISHKVFTLEEEDGNDMKDTFIPIVGSLKC